jgi:hypothetical protein
LNLIRSERPQCPECYKTFPPWRLHKPALGQGA